MTDSKPPLGPGPSDEIAGFLRIFISSIPVLGGALTELVTRVIPGVRQQRVEDYLRYLDAKLADADQARLRESLCSEPGLDLFEEGGIQVARAMTEERREQIATAVAKGLSGDEAALLEAKRILTLLRELDDGQVILLASKLVKNQRNDEFYARHRNVLTVVPPTLQSSREDLDRATVAAVARTKLVSLGLTRPRFKKPAKGQAPEWDIKTGMIAAQGEEITPLGRLLLRTIGVASDGDV